MSVIDSVDLEKMTWTKSQTEELDRAYAAGVRDGVNASEDWILQLASSGYSRPKEVAWIIERHRMTRLCVRDSGLSFDSRHIPLLEWPSWPEIRFNVASRDGFRCVDCGASGRIEVDHIVPVVRGGLAEESNLRTLCVECHRRKS